MVGRREVVIRIKKGLDLPLEGRPQQRIEDAPPPRHVAVLGDDYPGMRPAMKVREGDRVACGQLLFTDKKNEGLYYTAPAAGTIKVIHRGARRALLSVVIEVQGADAESFATIAEEDVKRLPRDAVVGNLVASGLWTALRTRPFSKPPPIAAKPHSLFVTAMDTNPLAVDPAVVIRERAQAFSLGLDVLAKLTDGPIYVCNRPDVELPQARDDRIRVRSFSGIHPAGLPGTHIHFLDPVSAEKTVWFIGYQDVIAVGALFKTGRLDNERVVALGGSGVRRPRLLRTTLGASLDELIAGELEDGELRVISGSVLSGRTAVGPWAFLGRYHNQVSVIPEDRERRLFGYLTSGFNRHSVLPIYVSKWLGRQRIRLTTSTNGSPRAMVPVGGYERVMPLNILPTQLLRSLLTGDVEMAIELGCLELDEDDIALCTYACPSKYEYGPILRRMLTEIEQGG